MYIYIYKYLYIYIYTLTYVFTHVCYRKALELAHKQTDADAMMQVRGEMTSRPWKDKSLLKKKAIQKRPVFLVKDTCI